MPPAVEVEVVVGPQESQHGDLFFGTDAPLLDPAYVLGLYADAGADLASTRAAARAVIDL